MTEKKYSKDRLAGWSTASVVITSIVGLLMSISILGGFLLWVGGMLFAPKTATAQSMTQQIERARARDARIDKLTTITEKLVESINAQTKEMAEERGRRKAERFNNEYGLRRPREMP